MASIHDAMDKQLYCRVLLLLERIPEVDVKDDKGMTIVMKCCYIDDVRTARVIAKRTLKYGADINMTDLSGKDVLCHTAITNNVTLVKLLLRNDNLDLIRKDNDGNTALHQAAIRGHVAIIEVITSPILKYRLPVDVRNGGGMTPLMLTCRHGHVETARYLVNECNASLTMRDDVRFMAARDWLAAAVIYSHHLNMFSNAPNVKKCGKQSQKSENMECLSEINTQATSCWLTQWAITLQEGLQTDNTNLLSEHKEDVQRRKGNCTKSAESTSRYTNSITGCRTSDLPRIQSLLEEIEIIPGCATISSGSTKSIQRCATGIFNSQKNIIPNNGSPNTENMTLQLFTLSSAQCSPSYCPSVKPPPPLVIQQTQYDEVRSRSHVTRSRFQKFMRVKRVQSVLASLRQGVTAANSTTEPCHVVTERTTEMRSDNV